MDANSDILDKHENDIEYQGFLLEVKYHLTQYVNYSSNILSWFIENTEDNGVDHILVWLLRNSFEALDGITVLLNDGCIRPTEPLFRILYETIATVFFIGEKDSKQRALHYYVTYLLNQRKILNKYPIEQKETAQFKFVVNEINKELKSPMNQSIVEKYNGYPITRWFSKCEDGPKNITELLDRMHHIFPKFPIFYSIYSGTVHGNSDWGQQLTFQNIRELAKLRTANDLKMKVVITVLLYNFLIDFVLCGMPKKKIEFWDWFDKNIKTFYDDIKA